MQDVALFIIGGLVAILVFALLAKLIIEGLRIFLKDSFKFFGGLLVIVAIGFIGYSIVERNKIQSTIDSVIFNKDKTNKPKSNNPFGDYREISNTSDTYIPTRNNDK